MKRSTNDSMWPSHQLQINCFGRSCQRLYLTRADRWLRYFFLWSAHPGEWWVFLGQSFRAISITCRRCCNVVQLMQHYSNWCRWGIVVFNSEIDASPLLIGRTCNCIHSWRSTQMWKAHVHVKLYKYICRSTCGFVSSFLTNSAHNSPFFLTLSKFGEDDRVWVTTTWANCTGGLGQISHVFRGYSFAWGMSGL